MEWLISIFGSAEFWMGLSLIAAALPGPQTRLFPLLLRAVSKALSGTNPPGSEEKAQ